MSYIFIRLTITALFHFPSGKTCFPEARINLPGEESFPVNDRSVKLQRQKYIDSENIHTKFYIFVPIS